MDWSLLKQTLSKAEYSTYQNFIGIIKESKTLFTDLFDLEKEIETSLHAYVSKLDDDFLIRVIYRSKKLAQELLDEKGLVISERVIQLINIYEEQKGFFYFKGDKDEHIFNQHLYVLYLIRDNAETIKKIERFSVPSYHAEIDILMRAFLGYSLGQAITQRDFRLVVLSSCFSILRQTVGSCFATAPAILIHQNQISLFLDDLYELMNKGYLTRTFSGVEYTVPLSLNIGVSELRSLIQKDKLLWFSPSFMRVCDFLELTHKDGPLEEKIKCVKETLANRFKYGSTIETYIKQIILDTRSNNPKFYAHLDVVEIEKFCQLLFMTCSQHPFVKIWEYTLASFSDIKMQFSDWNLYAGLGLDPLEKEGLGQVIYQYVERKLEETKEKTESYHRVYEQLFYQVKTVESQFSSSSSSERADSLKSQHTSLYQELQSYLSLRDLEHQKGEFYTQFFKLLIESYTDKFKIFFQEIYDPDIQETKELEYEDDPAGFRLVYKHGRSKASLWSQIYDADQWLSSLIDFFRRVELDISDTLSSDLFKQDLSNITDQIILQIRSPFFLKYALQRSRNKSLKGLKKPWVYVSGGTLDTLIKTYAKREHPLTEEKRKVDSPMDFLIYLVDLMKSLPPKITDNLFHNRQMGMLAYSHTHAFILKPSFDVFKQASLDKGFSYTWVRDHFIQPNEFFYGQQILSPTEQKKLVQLYFKKIGLPPKWVNHFSFKEHLHVKDVKNNCSTFLESKGMKFLPFHFDSICFESIPFFQKKDLPSLFLDLFKEDLSESSLAMWYRHQPHEDDILSSADFIDLMCLFFIYNKKYNQQKDLYEMVVEKLRDAKIIAPSPFIFADTNWIRDYFAFVVNPCSMELELWRVNQKGIRGMPMYQWKEMVDGSSTADWGFYTHPYEYGL
ncbi:MAG: hypothetical protein ACOVOR_01445 [Rhabdochlamydiaceae bacterium]